MTTAEQAPAARTEPHHRSALHQHLHRLGPLVPLLLGLYAALSARDMGLGELNNPGPGLWPFMVSVLIVACSATLLVIDDADDYEPWTRGTLTIIGGLVSLGIFILLFTAIGFFIPAVLMLVLWLRVFGEESWKWALPLAVVGATLFYLLFVTALGVPFPEGPLSQLSAPATGI